MLARAGEGEREHWPGRGKGVPAQAGRGDAGRQAARPAGEEVVGRRAQIRRSRESRGCAGPLVARPGRRAGAAREAGISRRADGPLREQICICQLSAPRETTGGECGSDLVLGKVTGKPEPMQRAWAARSGSEQVDDAGRWLL